MRWMSRMTSTILTQQVHKKKAPASHSGNSVHLTCLSQAELQVLVTLARSMMMMMTGVMMTVVELMTIVVTITVPSTPLLNGRLHSSFKKASVLSAPGTPKHLQPGLEALLAAFRVRRCCYKLGPTDEAGDAASFHAREVSRVDGTLLSRTVGSAHKAIPQLPS